MKPKLSTQLFMFAWLLAVLCGWVSGARAQQNLIRPNVSEPFVSSRFSSLSVLGATATGLSAGVNQWGNSHSVTDWDTTDYATLVLTARTVGGTLGCLTPVATNGVGTITLGDAANTYAVGNYVGFVIGTTATNATYKVETSNGGGTFTTVSQQSIRNNLPGKITVGGFAAAAYNQVRLTVTTEATCQSTMTSTFSVYYAVHISYDNGPGAPSCNTIVPLVSPYYDLSVSGSTLGLNNVIDENLNNDVSIISLLGIPGNVEVKDNKNMYPAGSYLGFKVANSPGLSGLLSIDLLNSITIKTFNNNTLVDEFSGSDVLIGLGLLTGSTPYEIGVVTTGPANTVRIEFSSALSALHVYHPIFRCFSEGQPLTCNTMTALSPPEYPVYVDKNSSGVVNVGLLGENIVNPENLVDGNPNTFVSVNQNLLDIGGGFRISVKKHMSPFPGGYFAGFRVGKGGLLGLELLDGLGVVTYLNGQMQDSLSGSGTLVNASTTILNGDATTIIGFKTDSLKPFDEIRLISTGLLSLNVLKQLRVYEVLVQEFCPGTAMSCNTLTAWASPEYPVYIDGKNTGESGILDISNPASHPEYAIDGDSTTYVELSMTATVGTYTTFAIADALNTYNANPSEKTYVAFDVSVGEIVNVDLLNAMGVHLIKPDGTLSDSLYMPKLLAGVGLLGSRQRQLIGIVADEPFIGVQLVINNLIGVDLTALRIYDVYLQELCPVALNCYESVLLTNQSHPVIINPDRSGTAGLANVNLLGSNIANIGNVIDTSLATYATITKSVGAISNTAISVLNPVGAYPTGSIAGFVVERSASIAELDLLTSIAISTYNDGQLQETSNAGTLLGLELLGLNLIGSGNGVYNLGFITSKPYDEIRITVNDLVGLDVGYLNVYGAFVDTRTAFGAGLFCASTSPDFAVTELGKDAYGDVATNDRMPTAATYSNPVADASNPNSNLPLLAADGTYSFSTVLPGKYVFNITVCLPGQTSDCMSEQLTVTVLDTALTTPNLPVVNPDVVYVSNTTTTPNPVVIDVLANDGIGNPGGILEMPFIAAGDSAQHGTLSTDINGKLVYTPAPGYIGEDYFTYTACETPSGLCGTALVKITVLGADAPNVTIAVDDYVSAYQGNTIVVSAAEGLLANDYDPEGDNQSVVAFTANMVDTGTLVVNADGSFEFAPVPSFHGPVAIPCQIVDDGNPSASSYATLHILMNKGVPDLTPSSTMVNASFNAASATSRGFIANISEILGMGTNTSLAAIEVRISKSGNFTYSFDPNATVVNGTVVNHADWELINETPTSLIFRLKEGLNVQPNGLSRIGLTMQALPGATLGTVNATITIIDGSGGEMNVLNNISIRQLLIF